MWDPLWRVTARRVDLDLVAAVWAHLPWLPGFVAFEGLRNTFRPDAGGGQGQGLCLREGYQHNPSRLSGSWTTLLLGL